MQINVKLLDLCGIHSYEFQQKKPIFKFSLRIKLDLNKRIFFWGGRAVQTEKIKNIGIFRQRASLVVQLVKNLPAMRETSVRSLGWEDPLEKGKATHSSSLAWRIPWTVSSWGCKESDMTKQLSHPAFHTFCGE